MTKIPLGIKNSTYEIHRKKLSKEVITCIEASSAKEFSLKNELKSLLLKTSKGFYVVHLAGNKKVSNRKIKIFLKCKEASMATRDELNSFGLIPGTVCAIINPIWELPHLISEEIFNLDFISTNDGTRTGYYIFSPEVLLLSNNKWIGNFIQ